jgi:hypothetical protein
MFRTNQLVSSEAVMNMVPSRVRMSVMNVAGWYSVAVDAAAMNAAGIGAAGIGAAAFGTNPACGLNDRIPGLFAIAAGHSGAEFGQARTNTLTLEKKSLKQTTTTFTSKSRSLRRHGPPG